jgi:hypothetical protein
MLLVVVLDVASSHPYSPGATSWFHAMLLISGLGFSLLFSFSSSFIICA